MIDGKGPHDPPSHVARDRDWQDTDYWYNRVVDAKNPASNTANPSALALITFGLTTALLQVLNKPCFRSTSHSAHMSCLFCFIENDISKVDAHYVQKDAKPWLLQHESRKFVTGSKHALDRSVYSVCNCWFYGVLS